MDAKEIGKRVRGARCYAGLNQAELAEMIGMGRGTLWKIEQGNRKARDGELWEIARACRVPYDRMIEEWNYEGPERRNPPSGER